MGVFEFISISVYRFFPSLLVSKRIFTKSEENPEFMGICCDVLLNMNLVNLGEEKTLIIFRNACLLTGANWPVKYFPDETFQLKFRK